MRSSSTIDETPPGAASTAGGVVYAVVAGLCLLFLGGVAGAFMMVQNIYPAKPVKEAIRGGVAYYYKMTQSSDSLDTDLWRPARTSEKGVVAYDPTRAMNGLTLYSSGDAQKAYLIDMKGNVVHQWSMPYSRIWDDTAEVKHPMPDDHIYIEKAHVFPNGDLLALYVAVGDTPWGYGLAKLGPDSKVIWKYLAHTHHDFSLDAQGNIFVLTQEIATGPLPGFDYLEPPRIDDFLVKLSPDGKVLKKIWVTGALAASPAGRRFNMVPWYTREGSGDYLHTNSVDIIDRPIPGVPGSHAGQALLSFREISTIGLLDPDSGKLVWATAGPWMRQHDAELTEAGTLMVFDNEGDLRDDASSRVLELRPDTMQIVWSYGGRPDQPLESLVRSSESRLANGNTLIVESDGGRVLEVTPSGSLVWEFVNPVRGGPDQGKIPIIFWVQRLDPQSLDAGFRNSLTHP
jgi:outer membrane protein assembly factor BamB